MAMAVASPAGKGGGYYGASATTERKTYNDATTRSSRSSSTGDGDALAGRIVLVLRAGAAAASFVAVALVASCRHGDWMEFARYQEYRYLLGASAVACVYSAAQALGNFRRGYAPSTSSPADFAGDQVAAYLLITACSAALPITLRMRSAVVNIFTDAITAAIGLGFIAFAALALCAIISAFFRITSSAQPY